MRGSIKYYCTECDWEGYFPEQVNHEVREGQILRCWCEYICPVKGCGGEIKKLPE